MKVRAIKLGYYGHKRRPEGSVFTLEPITRVRKDDKTGVTKEITIKPEQQFSHRWMEQVDQDVPEQTLPTEKRKRASNTQLN